MVEILKHNNIELVVFDYGGVIIDLFPERTRDAFRKYGLANPDSLYQKEKQIGLFDLLDKGHIKEEEFFHELKKFFPADTPVSSIRDGWNAMLGNIDKKKTAFLQTLRASVPVCLLSNTNEIHLQHIKEKIIPDSGIGPIENYFDKIYYSCRIAMRKPDREIFEHVVSDWKVSPEKILFLDDTEIHLNAATSLGWKTMKVQTNEEWTKYFNLHHP